jgi:hypothetical protein
MNPSAHGACKDSLLALQNHTYRGERISVNVKEFRTYTHQVVTLLLSFSSMHSMLFHDGQTICGGLSSAGSHAPGGGAVGRAGAVARGHALN